MPAPYGRSAHRPDWCGGGANARWVVVRLRFVSLIVISSLKSYALSSADRTMTGSQWSPPLDHSLKEAESSEDRLVTIAQL